MKKSGNFPGHSDNLFVYHVPCTRKEQDKDDNSDDIGCTCCGYYHREHRKADNQDRKARYTDNNIEQSCIHPPNFGFYRLYAYSREPAVMLMTRTGTSHVMERSAAVALLDQYVHDPGLKKHCLATGAVMKELAVCLGGDTVSWETIGILHDIDFELIRGDMQIHGIKGAEILTAAGIDPWLVRIIRQHNHHLFSGNYEQPVEIALQAADSASGLVIACALVKGGRLSEVSAKTVTKKAKEKSFAAGCDRNRIALIEPLLPVTEFYTVAIAGLLKVREELGLT